MGTQHAELAADGSRAAAGFYCNDPKIVVGPNSGTLTLRPLTVSFPGRTTVTVENKGPSPVTMGKVTFEPADLSGVLSVVNKCGWEKLPAEQTCQLKVTFKGEPKNAGEILVHYGEGGVATISVKAGP